MLLDGEEAMTDHSFASRPGRILSIAVVAALAVGAMAAAEAKQTCSTAAGAEGYWSWRMIDGRKCWYQGKPMLSKSSLEWPAQAAAASPEAASAAPAESHGDPMDAQAYAPAAKTFDALWRERIEGSRR